MGGRKKPLHEKNADQDVWDMEKMKQASGKHLLLAPMCVK